jgi:rRNA processing protein Krr1/Pno1
VAKAGGTASSAEHVRFPRQGDESDQLTVKGTADVVEKILAAIQSFVDERENQVTETVDVPVTQHRELIGPNGSIRKKLEEQFSVTLNVPHQGTGHTGVKISGRPEHVAKAKEHIQGLTATSPGETVMVPRALHHAVSKNGALFRDLSREGIRVDHNGQKPPPRSRDTPNGPRARTTTNGDMPLITDQPGEEPYSWDVVSNNPVDGDSSGEIPWVIMGGKDTSEDAVAKAKQKILTALEKAKEPQHTGYLILPDPRLHRHIIGRGGATINSIRKASGCDIQVPNRNNNKEDGEAITIVGQHDGVLQARDLILEEIRKAEAGQAGRGGGGSRNQA